MRSILRTVLVIVGVVLALYLIYRLRKPLAWIFIAGFLAIALAGPVNWLQPADAQRASRSRSSTSRSSSCPVFIGALLIPPIVEQVNLLIQNLPQYAADLSDFVEGNERLRQLEEDYNITAELEQQAAQLPARAGDAASILSGHRPRRRELDLRRRHDPRPERLPAQQRARLARLHGRCGAGTASARVAADGCSTASAARSATTSPARSGRR